MLGNPLSDFPGLPALLRLLESRGVATEIVPGVPRATLSASIAMPLVPLPPQSAHYTWDDLVEIMARLRMGCPWDREQTHRTLVPYLIEETYEVVEAIEGPHLDALCEELGDLLLQVLFHAQLATEVGKFSIADVVDALSNKMVRRHPHVFGDAVIEDVDAQWRNWEKLKALEKTGRQRNSRLDGIPAQLGALQRGQRMQEKAARVGFDWPNVAGILDKLSEELGELAEARRQPQDDPRCAKSSATFSSRWSICRARSASTPRRRCAKPTKSSTDAFPSWKSARRKAERASRISRSTNSRNCGNWRRLERYNCACA